MLSLLVNTGFQVLFHSPPGVLFTFPSRYYFAIGHQHVFSLGGWSPRLPTGFLVSCGTLVQTRRILHFAYEALTPSGRAFQRVLLCAILTLLPARNPRHPKMPGLGCFPFARRYLGNRFCFLFLRVLRCFSSPGSPRYTMYSYNADSALPLPGFPIRTSAYHSLCAAPRGFSQLTTSFFGVWCQGIRPVLFLA